MWPLTKHNPINPNPKSLCLLPVLLAVVLIYVSKLFDYLSEYKAIQAQSQRGGFARELIPNGPANEKKASANLNPVDFPD